MLTYQLHTRILKIENKENLTFPNEVELEVKLSPSTAFGTDSSPSRTLVRSRAAGIHINANTGRWLVQSNPPLEPLEVIIETPTSKFRLKGDILKYSFICSDLEELKGTLVAFKWELPTLLNVDFSDPPVVDYIKGQVGKATFHWEHKPEEWQIHMRVVSQNMLEEHIAESFERLSLLNGINNRRLSAALHYFHVGVRLNVCGDSPWEFMAESILNYSKCLEILFCTSENSKDDIRREMGKLGFPNDEIEGDYIPLLILRSWVDIAHPKVAVYKRSDLIILYKYIAQAEDKIRKLLSHILKRVMAGEYEIHQESSLFLDKEDQKGMDRLISSMAARIKV